MNPFSGSTILWSILGEYEHFKVLSWYCKGPKVAKIASNMTFCDIFEHFHSEKDKNESIFW